MLVAEAGLRVFLGARGETLLLSQPHFFSRNYAVVLNSVWTTSDSLFVRRDCTRKRATTFMLKSSCINNLNAYGIRISHTCSEVLHTRHPTWPWTTVCFASGSAKKPHFLHTEHEKGSDCSKSRSRKLCDAPCEMTQLWTMIGVDASTTLARRDYSGDGRAITVVRRAPPLSLGYDGGASA